VLRSQHRVYDGRGEVARTQDVWGAEGISGRVKFLLLAWAGMPKTSFRKNSDSPLIGLWIIVQAIRQTLAWYKFGKTPLSLNPFPGQIGGRCAGQLTLPISAKSAKHAILRLSCSRRYQQRANNGKRHWHTESLWQDKIRIKPDTYGRKIRLNFSFNPPLICQQLKLRVMIIISGAYRFACHCQAQIMIICKLPMQLADDQAIAATNRFKPKTSTLITPEPTENNASPKITELASGTQFYYGYGRSRGMGISIMLLGLFIAVFAYYFFAGFLDFLPATTGLMAAYVGLIALSLFVLGLFLIANSLTVKVGLMSISKQHHIFGFLLEEITDANDIVIDQNASSSSGNTDYGSR
jgi:hypothetical protein